MKTEIIDLKKVMHESIIVFEALNKRINELEEQLK